MINFFCNRRIVRINKGFNPLDPAVQSQGEYRYSSGNTLCSGKYTHTKSNAIHWIVISLVDSAVTHLLNNWCLPWVQEALNWLSCMRRFWTTPSFLQKLWEAQSNEWWWLSIVYVNEFKIPSFVHLLEFVKEKLIVQVNRFYILKAKKKISSLYCKWF